MVDFSRLLLQEGQVAAHAYDGVELLKTYLSDPKQQERPFLALGEYGCGRGHYIAETVRNAGFSPTWSYEPEPVPPSDLDGNALFPVYDVPKSALRSLPSPSVVLVPTEFDRRSAAFKDHPWALFGRPDPSTIKVILERRHLPVQAAEGNGTYASAILAAVVLDATGVLLASDAPRSKTWAEFRAGGPPPVPDPILPYYLAGVFPRGDGAFNRALYLRDRVVRAEFGEFILDAIRPRLPEGELPFPRILKVARPPRDRPESRRGLDRPEEPLPALPKTYTVDWP